MDRRLVVILASLAWLGFACAEEEVAVIEEVAPPVDAAPISGRYEVSGSTVAIESGYKRDISGTIILTTEGETYTATFELATTYPDPAAEEPIIVQVIGKGQGAIEGRTLRGSAQTQIVASTVPNVDPNFAFIPRSVSARIVSTSITTIAADGTVSIVIENEGAPGEEYTPTRTTLSGARISPGGIGKDDGG